MIEELVQRGPRYPHSDVRKAIGRMYIDAIYGAMVPPERFDVEAIVDLVREHGIDVLEQAALALDQRNGILLPEPAKTVALNTLKEKP